MPSLHTGVDATKQGGFQRVDGLKPPPNTTTNTRASEKFWGCLPQSPPKNLGQIPAALAISGIFQRFSPGPNGSEVGRQITLNSLTGPPTSGPFGPGENRLKMPEIATAARIWPKFFGGDWARHSQKFSLALLRGPLILTSTLSLHPELLRNKDILRFCLRFWLIRSRIRLH